MPRRPAPTTPDGHDRAAAATRASPDFRFHSPGECSLAFVLGKPSPRIDEAWNVGVRAHKLGAFLDRCSAVGMVMREDPSSNTDWLQMCYVVCPRRSSEK